MPVLIFFRVASQPKILRRVSSISMVRTTQLGIPIMIKDEAAARIMSRVIAFGTTGGRIVPESYSPQPLVLVLK